MRAIPSDLQPTAYGLQPAPFLRYHPYTTLRPPCNDRRRPPLFEQTFKNIDDVLWKEAGCSSELDYTEQTSWLLFLKYLDDLEAERAAKAELEGKRYTRLLEKQYRWSAWAAPKKTRRLASTTTTPSPATT